MTRHASGARTIGVHLTPFAPGCASYPIDDTRRWRTFWNAKPLGAMKATLVRIRRAPGDVRAEISGAEDVDLIASVHGLGVEQDGQHPLATIHCGLTVIETRQLLAELAQAGWRPTEIDAVVLPFAEPKTLLEA